MSTVFVPSVPNGISLVAVHGLGDPRSEMEGWCDSLAANGYTVITIEYPDPVTQNATFPMPVRAVKTAVQFLRENRARLRLTTNIVGAIGRSLGAGIIAQSLIDENDYSVYGIDNTVSDQINFAVLLYGIYDPYRFIQSSLPISIPAFIQQYFHSNTALEARETPVLQAQRVSAPLLLIHGESDVILQYQQSQEFHDSLSAEGKYNDLILYPNQDHLFEMGASSASFSPIGLEVKDSVLAFFAMESSRAGVSLSGPSAILAQNVPNPCGLASLSGSSSTTVSFRVPKATTCSIELVNRLGSIVRSSSPEFFSEGYHTLTLTVSGLPSGVYYYRISGGASSLARAIVIEN